MRSSCNWPRIPCETGLHLVGTGSNSESLSSDSGMLLIAAGMPAICDAPEADIPGRCVPEADMPGLCAPEADVPGLCAPEAGMPGLGESDPGRGKDVSKSPKVADAKKASPLRQFPVAAPSEETSHQPGSPFPVPAPTVEHIFLYSIMKLVR